MRNEPPTPGGHGKTVFSLAALLFILLASPGCVSLPGAGRVVNPVVTGKPVAMDNLLVTVTSLAADSEAEKTLFGEALVSGLKETRLFVSVAGNPADLEAGDGVKISVAITVLKKVTDNARAWTGALAGRARLTVRVTITDLKSGQPIEAFIAEGQSGASAYAGTTDEAVQQAVQPIVAEVLKLNAQTGQ
jgi:hypothetical protein